MKKFKFTKIKFINKSLIRFINFICKFKLESKVILILNKYQKILNLIKKFINKFYRNLFIIKCIYLLKKIYKKYIYRVLLIISESRGTPIDLYDKIQKKKQENIKKKKQENLNKINKINRQILINSFIKKNKEISLGIYRINNNDIFFYKKEKKKKKNEKE